MEKQNKKKFNNTKGIALLLIFISVIACFFGMTGPLVGHAEKVLYSPALTDLQKSEDFNIENYPKLENDYSLQVITIAESANQELFLYVYQPCADSSIVATCINMSLDNSTFDPYLYELELINHESTIFKYKVKDFVVKDIPIRIYDIVSIYREFNSSIDVDLSDDNDNTIDEVSYKVGKMWGAQNSGKDIVYSCYETEVITITDKLVGFVYYPDGFHLFQSTSCHSHFVAFSTDREIEKLLGAKVYYKSQSHDYRYQNTGVGFPTSSDTFGDIEDNYADLKYTDKTSYTSDDLVGNQHVFEWNRVQSILDFSNDVEFDYTYTMGLFNVSTSSKMTDEDKAKLNKYQWVLRFAETEYVRTNVGTVQKSSKTIVGDVSILELTFITNGQTFDLGVVDNKQSGSGDSLNNVKGSLSLSWWVYILIALFALILISPLMPGIFNLIFKLIKYIFKGLWWLITAPFSLFKKGD